MDEVELVCALYGEGTVFPVKIARDAKVSALQKAVFADQRHHERFSFPPSALTLYLAKKNGAWLKDDDSVDSLLSGRIDTSWKLENKELFGDFEFGDEEIHVLVELPDAAAGEKSVAAKMETKIDELHKQVVQTKRKRYVHSEMDSSKGRELLEDLNIFVEPVRTIPFAARAHTATAEFNWESMRDERGQSITLTELTEEQQRKRYRTYVEENIGVVLAEKKLCVIGVEEGQDILAVLVSGRNIELARRTDLLVLSDLVKEDPFDLQFLPGVKMLIEVKRTLKSGSVFQALSELIALDLLAKDPVIALLTDLTGNWHFFWVSEMCGAHATIKKATIMKSGEAFHVIRTLLTQPPSAGDAELRLPCLQEPIKRRKLAKILPTISEGGGSSGVRAAIERYYDIASVLGPDIDMARAEANRIARTVPVFSCYT